MNENKDLKKMLTFIKNTIEDNIRTLRRKYKYRILENNSKYIKFKIEEYNYITISKYNNQNIHINIDKIITINEINLIQGLVKLYEEEIHIQKVLKNGTGTNGTK